MTANTQRFGTLDAMRGVAAIAVIVFHDPRLGPLLVPNGYLAVDLFFMMSGFVIAHGYTARIESGFSPRAFLYRRGIRIWPMLAIGALLGMILHGGHAGSLLLLPNFRSPTNLFPANPVLWSLLFEAVAYVAFAFGGWKLGRAGLAILAGASGLVLMTLTYLDGPLHEFGPFWRGAEGGLARLAFDFSLGMLLSQIHAQTRRSAVRVTNLAWCAPALFLTLVLAVPDLPRDMGPLVVLPLFTGAVWLGLHWEVPQQWLAKRLGDLSYPLYCIHMPLMATFAHDLASAVAMAIGLPFVALALDRFIDRPARAALSRWLARDAGFTDQTRIGIST